MRSVTPEDVEKLVARLLAIAHGPDAKTAVQAANLLMNRLWGKPKEHVEVEAVATLAKPSRCRSPACLPRKWQSCPG